MPFGGFSGSTALPTTQSDTSSPAKSMLLICSLICRSTEPRRCQTMVCHLESLLTRSCACPLTKQKRDNCFMNSMNGEVECKDLIQAHREWIPSGTKLTYRCMAGFGFKV